MISRKKLEKLICDWRAIALDIYRGHLNVEGGKAMADYYCACADQLEEALGGKKDDERN